jgi:hypothetical protein
MYEYDPRRKVRSKKIRNCGSQWMCEDNLDPQLDQGNEEVIRVALLTFDLKR